MSEQLTASGTTVPPAIPSFQDEATGRTTIGMVLRRDMRNYVMVFALLAIIIVFWVWSNGTFVSPYNLTNLIIQTAVVGVMAPGMTLVIIIRHIDLSVGYMSGFLGAVAAILMVDGHVSSILAILAVLIIGGVIGVGVGLLIGKVGIPAFVITLGMMIVGHGVELLVTRSTGTIIIPDKFFNALSTGFIPSGGRVAGMCLSTVIIGGIGLLAVIVMQVRTQLREQRRRFDVTPLPVFIVKLVFILLVAGFLLMKMAQNNGISWALVILAIVTGVFVIVQTRTRFGRHVYGVGGNPEAAELSGVSVVRVTVIVFVIMGVLMALGGVLTASRMHAAYPTAGTGLELLVIAGCFIGGCSPAGGVGKVFGSLIGALIMQALVNGMLLMKVDNSMQYIIQGVILVIAVVFDVISRKAAAVPARQAPRRAPADALPAGAPAPLPAAS